MALGMRTHARHPTRPGTVRAGAEAVRMHEGYDHSYYFMSTFMEDHVKFHAEHLV